MLGWGIEELGRQPAEISIRSKERSTTSFSAAWPAKCVDQLTRDEINGFACRATAHILTIPAIAFVNKVATILAQRHHLIPL
jgi:hypothetical protein